MVQQGTLFSIPTTVEFEATNANIFRRLKTAHDALTTHLSHQSRTLTSLTASFSGPRAIIPDLEAIESLLPLITSTLELLPLSSPQPVIALSQLSTSTRDLLEMLSNISDSLHMSRQATTNASRRIKSSKEQLGEWKRDMEAKEAGVLWIEEGNWDRRLKDREAGSACRDVVSGFEEMFGQYRQRLCEGLGVASA
jgi:methyl-accepting chemotaxis protein